VVEVETPSASPFAQSLLFGWVGQYMYEYDAPLAERRAAALSLDRDLLRELLGGDELRDLLDADVLVRLERELQLLGRPRTAEDPDEDASTAGRATRTRSTTCCGAWATSPSRRSIERCVGDPTDLLDRACSTSGARSRSGSPGQPRIAAAEDAARLRDGLGVSVPPGLPQAFTEPVDDPLGELVARYARTHGPFTTSDAAARLGVPAARVEAALRWLERQGPGDRGRVPSARRAPAGRRTAGVGRHRGAAASQAPLAGGAAPRGRAGGRRRPGPLPARLAPVVSAPGGSGARRGPEALLETVAQLQGAPIPASVLEADVLPARVEGYRPGDLDELIAAGEVVWVGVEPLGARDGRIALCFRDRVGLVAPGRLDPPGTGARARRRPRGGGPRRAARPPAPAGRELLARALRGRGRRRPGRGARRAVGPRVGGRGHQRHLRAGARDGAGGGRSTASRRGRPRPGGLRRAGPPAAAGRWSATAELLDDGVGDTERAHALAEQLLERHGVLSRESLRVEAVAGGFAAVYRVLKAMEEAGRARRGYVVAGLGAAQFAVPGAIDRLRSLREPASPSGAGSDDIDWPGAGAGGDRPGPALRRRAAVAAESGAARRAARVPSWSCSTAAPPPTSSAAGAA
jgi:ATP-dependent helicase Lhr and Lhr-like helicase